MKIYYNNLKNRSSKIFNYREFKPKSEKKKDNQLKI